MPLVIAKTSTPSAPSAGNVTLYLTNDTVSKLALIDDSSNVAVLQDQKANSSITSVSAGYASDTYLAGSNIVIPAAGGWRAGTTYYCLFDMTKTAAGTATSILTLRMGTLGTTSDASVAAQIYAAGTAAADTGIWEVWATFRSVGSGTSAVLQLQTRITKTLTTTGLINSANIVLMTGTTSSGFNSTTQTTIGLSFNGGTSFSGTNTIVQAALNQS